MDHKEETTLDNNIEPELTPELEQTSELESTNDFESEPHAEPIHEEHEKKPKLATGYGSDEFIEKVNFYYEKLNKFLDVKQVTFLMNNSKDFSESIQYQVYLISKSNFNYEKIAEIVAKLRESLDSAMKEYPEQFDGSLDSLLQFLKQNHKQIAKVVYSLGFVEKDETSNEPEISDEVATVEEEPEVDESTLTPEELLKKKIKKFTLKEKFEYIKQFKWFKDIRKKHVQFYIVARSKDTEKRELKRMQEEFLKHYNQLFETNLTPATITRDFKLIYEKQVWGYGFKNAIRIWIAVAIAIIAIIVILCIVLIPKPPPPVDPNAPTNPIDPTNPTSLISMVKSYLGK